MKKGYQLTTTGVNELESELKALNAAKPAIAEKIRVAREQGDLRENSEYQIAKDELSRTENRINEIEHILQNVTLIDGKAKKGEVDLGSSVELKNQEGKSLRYTIVGSVEADPVANKISNESPIGKALIGCKVGDEVTIKMPSGNVKYKIVSIS